MARELKYFSPETDLSQLEKELAGQPSDEDSIDYDKWADYADEDDK